MVKDYIDGHHQISPRQGGGVRKLELGGNIGIKHGEAPPGDVLE